MLRAGRQQDGWFKMMTAHKLAVPGPAGAALRHRLVAFGLIFGIGLAVYAMPVAATVLAGEALYRERIMPPTDAVLVVTLWTAARADAPATELANARQRLAGAPPYAWTLVLDERLAAASPGAVVRAHIDVGGAMWMTTDTVTPAFSVPPPALVLRMVQAAPTIAPTPTPVLAPAVTAATPAMLLPCAKADTQAALNACSYDQFLDASAGLAAQLREVESRLSPQQRRPWGKVQKAWLGYRFEACKFESMGIGIGSAGPMVQWYCNARLTRLRSEELARSLVCLEGNVLCVLRRRAGGDS